MDDYSLSLLLGWPLTLIAAFATLLASVVEECLKVYHSPDFFEKIPPERHAKYERLLARYDDFLLVARLGRLGSQVICFGGVMLLLSARGVPFAFTLNDLALAGGVTLGVGIMFAGIVPAIWANNWSEVTLRRLLPGFALVSLPLMPLVAIINVLERGVRRVKGDESPEDTPEQEFEDDIENQLDQAARQGMISDAERTIIENVIDFARDTVRDVMTPRTDMHTVDVSAGLGDALVIASRWGHSRIPVTGGSRDKVLGILHLRDLMAFWNSRSGGEPPLAEVMRPALFVPETKKLAALLADFRNAHTHIAIALDEHGGVAGLVTMEDVLEQIVGDIQDEFDEHEAKPVPVNGESGRTSLEVDARMRVDDLNDSLGVELPESPDYSSIGGLISARLGRIPRVGEQLVVGPVNFTVLEADERALRRVSVRREETGDDEAE